MKEDKMKNDNSIDVEESYNLDNIQKKKNRKVRKKIMLFSTIALIAIILISVVFVNKNVLNKVQEKRYAETEVVTENNLEAGLINLTIEVKEETAEIYKCLLLFKSNDENNKIKSIEYPKKDGENINIIQIENKEGRQQIGIDYEINKSIEEEKFKITTSKGDEIEKEIVRHIEHKFEYITDSYHEFEVKIAGTYKIECWGATGGNSTGHYGSTSSYAYGQGGRGGYTYGEIYLDKGEKLYIYVGSRGANAIAYRDSKAGYNGGGLGTWDHSDDEAAGAGGGATDIRLVSGEWNSFDSLKSRIMVAGGGAGASWRTSGGAGGGWQGLTNRVYSQPGTQTSGYKFGIGQDGYGVGASNGVGGAGGGYYGGTTNDYADDGEAGAGGSSFISGNENCNAISESSTENNVIHTNQPIHYSGKYFKNSITEDGNNLTHLSNNNDGNGLAKITFLY